jgi:hypothetical protein
MPAKDTYHNAVENALIKDGWTITHDPKQDSSGSKISVYGSSFLSQFRR